MGAEVRKLREAQARGELVIVPSADAISLSDQGAKVDFYKIYLLAGALAFYAVLVLLAIYLSGVSP